MTDASAKTDSQRFEIGLLALILLLSIGLRLVLAAQPRVVRWDEAAYQLIARSLLAGQGFSELLGTRDIQQPPMVALLSLPGMALRLPLPWATAGLVQVLLGGLLPLPLYGLGKGIYGPRIGLIAALLAAVHPALAASPLYWSSMTEPLYLLFVASGVYGAWRAAQARAGARPGPWFWAAWQGVAFGLAYLTRPEALVFLVVMAGYVVIWRWYDSWSAARRSSAARPGPRGLWEPLAMAAMSGAVCLLLALPYVVYIHRVTGIWTLSGKAGTSMAIAQAYVNNSQAEHDRAVAALDSSGKEILWLSPEAFDLSLAEWILPNPRRFLHQVRTNVAATRRELFFHDLFTGWQAALMLLGLFAAPWSRRRLRGESLLLLALLPLASLWIFFILSRFLVVFLPIGLLWMAAGLVHLDGWLAGTLERLLAQPLARGWTRGLRVLPPALAMLALLWSSVAVVRREAPLQPFWRVEAARWLTENTPPGSPVMLRNTEVALYAGLPAVALPNAPWPKVHEYARLAARATWWSRTRKSARSAPTWPRCWTASPPSPYLA